MTGASGGAMERRRRVGRGASGALRGTIKDERGERKISRKTRKKTEKKKKKL